MGGRLYIVSTPIGNLQDLSERARLVLTAASAVVCEDTRVTRKLLEAHGIEQRPISFHAHSTEARAEQLLERLTRGEDLALVSDAGTPLLSDPGAELVHSAIERGIEVVPIPGASALLAALVASGVRPQPFVFLGFLPRTRGAQRELLGPFSRLDVTLVIFEGPARVAATLARLTEICGGGRPACVARELTKRYETFERGSLEELAERLGTGVRGEVVIVVGPPVQGQRGGEPISDEALASEARRLLLANMTPSEAAKALAVAHGVPRKRAYRAVLDVAESEGGGAE